MNFENPAVLWGIAGLVLLVLEMFTGTFFALFCGVAALFASASAFTLFADDITGQWVIFIVLSILLPLVLLKPLKKKFGSTPDSSTFNDHLGKQVTITERIGEKTPGKAMYKGSTWIAKTLDDSTIEVGEIVTIVAVDGVNLVVKK